MSTIGLIGRTSAATSREAIHAGEDAAMTSATAAAYRGHRSSSWTDTAIRSDAPAGSVASRTRAPGSVEGGAIGRS